MKKLLPMTLLALLLCNSSMADTETVEAGAPDTAHLKFIEPYTAADARGLATAICAAYTQTGNKLLSAVKKQITNTIKEFTSITNPNDIQIVEFVNARKHDMQCSEGEGENLQYKHFLKVALDKGRFSIIDTLLVDQMFYDNGTEDIETDDLNIDVNAVSFTGPNFAPQTTLDYIDDIIAGERVKKQSFIDQNEHPRAIRSVSFDFEQNMIDIEEIMRPITEN